MATVLQRPHSLILEAARPIQRDGEPSIADLDGLIAQQLAAAAATAAIVCELLCMSHRARSL
jgi:hypothetical protein